MNGSDLPPGRTERGATLGPGPKVAVGVIAAAVTGFAILARAVGTGRAARLDDTAHSALLDFFGGGAAGGSVVTWFGNNATITTLVVLVAAALVLTKHFWAAFRVVLASGVGGIVVVSLKALFARDRPLDTLIEASGYSFPSGHAFASTVFYGMMLYLVWRLTERVWARTLAAVGFPMLIAAVGLSRVFLNVHYLSDVLAGWLAGIAWLMTVLAAVRVVETRARDHAEVRHWPAEAPPDDGGLGR